MIKLRREVERARLTATWWFVLSFLACAGTGVGSAYVADLLTRQDTQAELVRHPTSACGDFLRSMVIACSPE